MRVGALLPLLLSGCRFDYEDLDGSQVPGTVGGSAGAPIESGGSSGVPASGGAGSVSVAGGVSAGASGGSPAGGVGGAAGGATSSAGGVVETGTGGAGAGVSGGRGGSGAVGSGGGSGGGGASGGTAAGGSGGASGGTAAGGSGGTSATPVCGNGTLEVGEDCDDAGESATCNVDCSDATCGDGQVNPTSGEECEPTLAADCGTDCRYTSAHYLVHRYSFNESGTTLVDSVGGADGTLVGTTLDGSGQMVLAGAGSGQYGDLPNGMISALSNASFEFWIHWSGGIQWQRVFEFGSSVGGENVVGQGETYLVVVPYAYDGATFASTLRLAFTNAGSPAPYQLDVPPILPTAPGTHLVVVVDDDHDALRMYVDTTLVGELAFTHSLSDLDDVNNWLGRSQWTGDPEFGGAYDEFRVYGRALSAQEIADSHAAGPNF